MIRSVSFIFAFQLVSILTFSGSALSQCIDYSRHVQSVGNIELPDLGVDVAAAGSYAYVAEH